ncbi:hypothetical protein R2P79_04370 [Faecalibacterium duncaniae]|jgi:hypothetical protein|uniref:hypothetical protein n=1 Tax=Faecalibacterium duncaniae (strain DSM 17677 / JCM 31915 / A2-165) TaxID=411483 RepID=UPI002940AA92|nr:hypothetical protein [Faecalibacterium duncaniae]MDV5093331.1 hypothetical protein [Faecalibacterium duncaniae]
MARKKNDVVNNGEKTKKKPNGCAIIVAILVFGLAFSFLSAKNIADDVDVVFDATKYEHEDGSGLTEDELISMIGEPDSTEDWTYSNGQTVHTLFYGNNTYDFVFERLHRITLYDVFPYKYKDQFLTMFNLKKTGKTTVNDTGTWYRAYNCGINDLWLNYEDDKITTSIITYSTFFNS